MNVSSVIELRNASIYHLNGRRGLFRRSSRPKGSELVLSDVNVRIGRGELVYLIGKVGSGKSTFLKALYGEVEVSEGEAVVSGFNLRKLKRRHIPKLRRRMGIVFQDYQLLGDRSVFNNLKYVMKATGWKNETTIRKRIAEVLELVGLSHKEYKMPFELSGGEQQRLAIARALVNNPDVLLADEPTGNLDPASTKVVMDIFMKIVKGGCSIVMSTHNIHLLGDYPARTLRFRHGKVEEVELAPIIGE